MFCVIRLCELSSLYKTYQNSVNLGWSCAQNYDPIFKMYLQGKWVHTQTVVPYCISRGIGALEEGASSVADETCWDIPSPAFLQKRSAAPVSHVI